MIASGGTELASRALDLPAAEAVTYLNTGSAQLFPDEPLPARSAVGVYALPGGASVEIDCVVLLR